MKKTLTLSLLTALALGTTALAQGAGHEGRGGRFFDKLDTNQDGSVSREELQADVQRRFAEADTNKDGKVSAQELQAHAAAKRSEMQQKMAERIQAADV